MLGINSCLQAQTTSRYVRYHSHSLNKHDLTYPHRLVSHAQPLGLHLLPKPSLFSTRLRVSPSGPVRATATSMAMVTPFQTKSPSRTPLHPQTRLLEISWTHQRSQPTRTPPARTTHPRTLLARTMPMNPQPRTMRRHRLAALALLSLSPLTTPSA